MTDYRYIYSERLKRRGATKAAFMFAGLVLALGVVGHFEEVPVPATDPVVAVAKSAVQERIETILPADIAKPIAERSAYPKTMAAIAHTESRGDHRAIGDGGASKGAFQIQERHWAKEYGTVPDAIEQQVDQANRLFVALVNQYGYREAVRRWNGAGAASRKYQRVVLAKVMELER